MKIVKNVLLGALSIAIFGSVMYGSYWVAKNISYVVFYESLVQETVREMVLTESLRGN